MNVARLTWLGAVVLMVGLAAAATTANTASNTLGSPNADGITVTVTPDLLAPAKCGSIVVSSVGEAGEGTAGNDLLLGSAAGDTLDGLGGRDCILGGGGADTLLGGEGADRLFGQGGNDTILGQGDSDVLFGGAGMDGLAGGDGNDSLFGLWQTRGWPDMCRPLGEDDFECD